MILRIEFLKWVLRGLDVAILLEECVVQGQMIIYHRRHISWVTFTVKYELLRFIWNEGCFARDIRERQKFFHGNTVKGLYKFCVNTSGGFVSLIIYLDYTIRKRNITMRW